MAKKQKFYVVWEGIKPGIYYSWEDCKAQVSGKTSAKYKSFESLAAAEFAFKKDYFAVVSKNTPSKKAPKEVPTIIHDSISTDAACSGNPGLMEYQGVETMSKKLIFHQGPFKDGTNNIGEFLALVHGLSLLKKLNNNHTAIYTDSKTAMSWVKNKKAKTNLEKTKDNKILFEMIERAENWLKSNSYQNKIIKWETDVLGEIPADFGRK